MNITKFKKGDLITRNEPVVYPNSVKDTSYIGEEIEFFGVEDGIIVVSINKDVCTFGSAEGWGEGWARYPVKLVKEAESILAEREGVEKV